MFSENGININSSQQKDNFLNNHENNNNNLNNLNSYAKSTTISTSNASSSNSSSTSFAHQLRILIPNYDNLLDTIRSQQPHSSRAGGSGMQNDRRNMMMNDRRMMDRQMVRLFKFATTRWR